MADSIEGLIDKKLNKATRGLINESRLEQEVLRLEELIESKPDVDPQHDHDGSYLTVLESRHALQGKSDCDHCHELDDIQGLDPYLSGKISEAIAAIPTPEEKEPEEVCLTGDIEGKGCGEVKAKLKKKAVKREHIDSGDGLLFLGSNGMSSLSLGEGLKINNGVLVSESKTTINNNGPRGGASAPDIYQAGVKISRSRELNFVSGATIEEDAATGLLNITIDGGGGGGSSAWGGITGTLSAQTDLQAALDAKVAKNTSITSGTKTKITYDAKGLVTGGVEATTADIPASTNKNYVTDAQLTVIGNTSGINTGDQASIVGITGARAQFDAACTDGNFLYSGDVTQYTDEMAQDAVGNILTDSSEIDFTYNDAANTITAALVAGSIDESRLDTSVNASLDLADSAAQNTFKTIAISGQSDVVADSATDTLTLVAGSNITLTTNASTDTITIAASGGSTPSVPSSATPVIDDKIALFDTSNSDSFAFSTIQELFFNYRKLQARYGFHFYTDFMQETSATATDGALSELNSGSGAAVTSTAVTSSSEIGIARLATGTTATGRSHLYSGFAGGPTTLRFGGGSWFFETKIKVTTLSDGTNRFQLPVGFFDLITTAAQTNGAFFLYDEGGVSTGSAASANWQVCTTNGGTRTYTTTSIAVSTSAWVRLEVEVNAAGTSVAFYIDGVLVATHTTNIPTANTVGFGMGILKSIGTTSRTVDSDYVNVVCDLTAAR